MLTGIPAGILAALAAATGSARAVELDLARPSASWFAPDLGPDGVAAKPPLRGGADLKDRVGWVELPFEAAEDGWHRVTVETDGVPHRVRLIVDPERDGGSLLDPVTRWAPAGYEAGRVWLARGRHVLRIEKFYWTALPAFRSVRVDRLDDATLPNVRIETRDNRSFRVGECEPLAIVSGGGRTGLPVLAEFRREGGTPTRRTLSLPRSDTPVRTHVPLPCDEPGDWSVTLQVPGAAGNAEPLGRRYAVFSPRPVAVSFDRGRLVAEIDAAARAPDYASDRAAVEESGAGRYRRSGPNGLQAFSRGRTTRQPSWFAYSLAKLVPDRPYLVEIDYPDDGVRGFLAALRERGATSYPVSVGVNTGLEWPLSGRLATTSMLTWAKTPDPRLVFIPNLDGTDAAVSRVKVYEADRTEMPAPPPPSEPRRAFVIWAEEGESYLDGVSMREKGAFVHEGLDRWMAASRSAGATALMPTVLVYSFAQYPSRFNRLFSGPDDDLLRATLLGAEHYGLTVTPQLHPRADELAWVADTDSLRRRLALSKDGRTSLFGPNGRNYPPFYNALDPDVQDWYVGMIGELADRYRDFPAFKGIDLRTADWTNPGLNNLVSLDWGYDARTVARFFAESGLPVPDDARATADDAAGATARSGVLLSRFRDAWIAWRCREIARLYGRIRDRVRVARPDLVVSTSVIQLSTKPGYDPKLLPEAGIDLDLLKAIDGVQVVEGQHPFGRKEGGELWARQTRGDFAVADSFLAYGSERASARVLTPKHYIEATSGVAPAEALGLPKIEPGHWISAALDAPGRLALERYALPVGLADAASLGEGGNVNTRPPAVAIDFIRVFTSLPALPFRRLPSVPDSVAVWTRDGWAYAVNLQPVPVTVSLQAGGTLRGVPSGEVLRPDGAGRVPLALQPFELVAFRAEGGGVTGADATLPDDAIADLRRRVDERAALGLAGCGSSRWLDWARSGQCTAYMREVDELGRDLAAGRYWSVRRELDGADLRRLEAGLTRSPGRDAARP